MFRTLGATVETTRSTNCANAPNIPDEFCADSPLTAYGVQTLGATVETTRSTNCAIAPFIIN